MKFSRRIIAVLSVTLLTFSCAQNQHKKDNIIDGHVFTVDQVEAIVHNLTTALVQIEDYQPQITTVQMNNPKNSFGSAVLHNLKSKGYGIQFVAEDQGLKYVRYKSESAITEEGARIRYGIHVGKLKIERDFKSINSKLLPDSPIYISGASTEQSIEVNDSIFGVNKEGWDNHSRAMFMNTASPIIKVLPSKKESTAKSGSAGTPRKNIFHSNISNYANIFQNYEDINSSVLTFENDSLRLGKDNKVIVNQIANTMNPITDIISIIGCSHGMTKLKNGNSVLAVGRANRVKEALMYAGVDTDLLMDEGCWANGRFHRTMPKRGVVVTIKRKIS